jgi:hypothetical protein
MTNGDARKGIAVRLYLEIGVARQRSPTSL